MFVTRANGGVKEYLKRFCYAWPGEPNIFFGTFILTLTIRHNSTLLVSTRLISRSMFVDELLCFQLNFTFALMQHRTKLILDSWFLHILNSNWWPSSSPNTINKRFVSLMDACRSFFASNFWSCFWSF